ncbi:hypothetical protein KL925_004625 [Ogataea polymorpha]|nr:hypothetical protein KL925_004625 [Ogataea polymorpha]
MADKAVYQYNLVHAAKDGRLRRQLRRRFLATCHRHSLMLPEAVGEDGYIFCHRCEDVLVSGINLQIRVRYESKGGVRKRLLCYKCLGCRHEMTKDVLVQGKEAGKSVEKSNAKERARKRKKNNLSELLKNKQPKQAKTLDLMDFMKM